MRYNIAAHSQQMFDAHMFPDAPAANKDKIVLDLCGGTGAWSYYYREAGYTVYLIDIENGHDVRLIQYIKEPIDIILAAPPCTEFSLLKNFRVKESPRDILGGLSVVDACMRIIILKQPRIWALENPSGLLRLYLGQPAFIFHPNEYGDPWTKKTCLWGQFNIPKKNKVTIKYKNRIKDMPGIHDRARLRAVTPAGFAKAFYEANQ
jgi:hypothetical protein